MSSSPVAGWYPDPSGQRSPSGQGQLRYWDGQRWTEHVHEQQPAQSSQQPPSYGQGYGQPQGQSQGQSQGQGWGPTNAQPGAYATATYGGSSQARTTPDGRTLAGWGERLGAWLIDGVILGVLVAIPVVPIYLSMFHNLTANVLRLQQQQNSSGAVTVDPFTIYQGMWGKLALIYAIGLVGSAIYQVGFLVWKQATPGKLMLGLRVEPRSGPGPITLWTAVKRWGVTSVPALVASGLWTLLDGLWPLWDKDRQAVHEKWAATNVVKRQ